MHIMRFECHRFQTNKRARLSYIKDYWTGMFYLFIFSEYRMIIFKKVWTMKNMRYMSFNAYVPFVLAIESTRQYSLLIVWVDCIIAIKWFIDTATRIFLQSQRLDNFNMTFSVFSMEANSQNARKISTWINPIYSTLMR